MNMALVVQGEGRGHLTQALAFRDWCRRRGHDVVAVMASRPASRSWPAFFEDALGVPVTPIASPEMVYRRQRRLDLPATLWALATRIGAFRRSVEAIAAMVDEARPDLVVNFLEPIAAAYARRRRRPAVLAIGHQFMLRHPRYPRPRPPAPLHWGYLQYVNYLGSADACHALSYYDATPQPLGDGAVVAPPLLRDQVLSLDGSRDDGHVLAYLLNAGYLPTFVGACARRPGVRAHVFCHRPGAPAAQEVVPGVTVHALDACLFLQLMATARLVICSAGFESLSEAGWLGKPTLAVPVEGHVEQWLNATDAEAAGLCRLVKVPGLAFVSTQPEPARHARFRSWILQSDARLDASVALARDRHRAALGSRPGP